MDIKAWFAVFLLGVLSVVTLTNGQERLEPKTVSKVSLIKARVCLGTTVQIRCNSVKSTFSRCRHYDGTIKRAKIIRDYSRRACRTKGSWGFDAESVWVDKGCRAMFEVCVEPFKSEYGPPWLTLPVCPPLKRPCCEAGQLVVDLAPLLPMSQGLLYGVNVMQFGTLNALAKSCNRQALVSADFERITTSSRCFGCLEGPYCGRRMLKIELQLSYVGKSGWLFNVGDSKSNDGYGGDSGTQKNDAEVYCNYPNITIYGKETCGTPKLMNIFNGCGMGVHTLTLYVSNEHIRITNNQGMDYRRCHRCLFALNGQPDTGGVNEKVYIGLNRVVKPDNPFTRFGSGVCKATFSWACPWCD